MTQEVQHGSRRSWLPFLGCGLAVGRVRNDAMAAISDGPARKEIHAWSAEPAVSNVRRDHLIAVRSENGGDRASATAWLPHWPPEADVLKQRLGHPRRSRVIVAALPVVAGHMDRPEIRSGRGHRMAALCRCGPDDRQGMLMWCDSHQRWAPDYTASFSSLAGRNATFLLALILMASPVAGFRPIRAARLRTWSIPIPVRRTLSPFLR